MPNIAFNKLTANKKKQILEAGYLVFGEYGYQNTSINQITKVLNMTRTSFYYYFSDKDDFYHLLVEDQKQAFLSKYIYNKEQKVDLFDIFLKLFDYLTECKKTPIEPFLLDLFYNISFDKQNELLKQLEQTNRDYSHFTGFNHYAMQTESECHEVVMLLFILVYHEIMTYYRNSISAEDAKCELEKKMNLLKYGIIKKEN